MDVDTIAAAFGCSQARARESHDGINAALAAADCTTARRCAMFAAQIGHETLSLIYDQEIWGPTDAQRRYEGRRDLGNTVAGDGYRFRGRGRIQLTGRANYGAFSRWCHGRALTPTADHFVRHPDLVADPPWRELAASWYWTAARPGINPACDRGDVREVTRLINGGANGLADRQDRYAGALRLGGRLLPNTTGASAPAPGGDWFDMATEDDLRRIVREETPVAVWHHPIPDWFTPEDDTMPAFAAMGWATTHAAHARTEAGAIRAELVTLRTALAKTATAAAGGVPITEDAIAGMFVAALAEVGPLYLSGRDPAA